MIPATCKAHDSSHNGVHFLAQSVLISDSIKRKYKCLLEGVEYVLYRPVHRIIWCPVHDSVTHQRWLSKFLEIKRNMHQRECDDCVVYFWKERLTDVCSGCP
jgi:hypothetical protein